MRLLGADQTEVPIKFIEQPRFDTSRLPETDRKLLEQLKTGITREQLEKHFTPDGGLIAPFHERYYHRGVRLIGRENEVLMFDIAFKPAAMDEATFSDFKRRIEWARSHDWSAKPNDVVRAISKPYVSGIAID